MEGGDEWWSICSIIVRAVVSGSILVVWTAGLIRSSEITDEGEKGTDVYVLGGMYTRACLSEGDSCPCHIFFGRDGWSARVGKN